MADSFLAFFCDLFFLQAGKCSFFFTLFLIEYRKNKHSKKTEKQERERRESDKKIKKIC